MTAYVIANRGLHHRFCVGYSSPIRDLVKDLGDIVVFDSKNELEDAMFTLKWCKANWSKLDWQIFDIENDISMPAELLGL